jgi:hypothetical protein
MDTPAEKNGFNNNEASASVRYFRGVCLPKLKLAQNYVEGRTAVRNEAFIRSDRRAMPAVDVWRRALCITVQGINPPDQLWNDISAFHDV